MDIEEIYQFCEKLKKAEFRNPKNGKTFKLKSIDFHLREIGATLVGENGNEHWPLLMWMADSKYEIDPNEASSMEGIPSFDDRRKGRKVQAKIMIQETCFHE